MRKLRTKVFLLAAIALWAAPKRSWGTGRTIGNGGSVVACPQTGTEAPQLELLDYYELRVLRGVPLALGRSDLPVQAKVEVALARLDSVSPKRARRYREHASTFFAEALFLKNARLAPIPDSDPIAIPEGCEIRQIANQSEPLERDSPRYIIDDSLWQLLDNDQRAGLILHELIYREAIEMGHTNSVSARHFNGLISSERIESMPLPRFCAYLRELGFTTTSIQGLDVLLDELPHFHPDGTLASAHLLEGTVLHWSGQAFTLRGQIVFHPSSVPASLILSKPQDFVFLGVTMQTTSSEIRFFASGALRTIELKSPSFLFSESYGVAVEGQVEFNADGTLRSGRITEGTARILGTDVPLRGFARFFDDGRLQIGLISNATLIATPAGEAAWKGTIRMSDSAQIEEGRLAYDAEFRVSGSRVRASSRHPVFFYPYSGLLKRACLAADTLLPNGDGAASLYKAGHLIELSEEGWVQANLGPRC